MRRHPGEIQDIANTAISGRQPPLRVQPTGPNDLLKEERGRNASHSS